jgi:hypothetical protein
MNFKFSAIPSPDDSRDYPIAKLATEQKVHPKNYISPYMSIFSQGSVGGCVPSSMDYYCMSVAQMMKTGSYGITFSPGFGYGYRESDQWQKEGMIPRERLQNLLKVGAVPLKNFSEWDEVPTIINKVNAKKSELIEIAKQYRISAYCRLYTVEEIKTALLKLGLVTIMIPVYGNIYSLNRDNTILPMPPENANLLGRHEVTIIGWRDDNTWIVLNSWGDKWCKDGVFNIPFNFPIVEAWSLTHTAPQLNLEKETSEIVMKVGSKIYFTNDKMKTMDVAPFIQNNRTFTPVRYVAEELGATVEWDETNRIITIKKGF